MLKSPKYVQRGNSLVSGGYFGFREQLLFHTKNQRHPCQIDFVYSKMSITENS